MKSPTTVTKIDTETKKEIQKKISVLLKPLLNLNLDRFEWVDGYWDCSSTLIKLELKDSDASNINLYFWYVLDYINCNSRLNYFKFETTGNGILRKIIEQDLFDMDFDFLTLKSADQFKEFFEINKIANMALGSLFKFYQECRGLSEVLENYAMDCSIKIMDKYLKPKQYKE